ncbi:diaminopimelate epimerase [Luminiphilus syltensis NOR5-1B]|uniref:Diaminopimelate epimerase n=2 Tax=Luminiphilus TaxID=1341118 RepID=B8KSV1_9GAMM|nr:diaminopimelate epimerase [Luminiphilus syltensis NOR5-1B]
MHGAGNDFVVIDLISQFLNLKPAHIRFIADRQRGIGCDQVLLVEPPTQPENDFRYRIYNADGSESGQCGNGARCFARFVREKSLTWKRELQVETRNGTMALTVAQDGRINANLGAPIFDTTQIPFQPEDSEDNAEYGLTVAGNTHRIGALSMGNPHAVLTVDSVADAPVSTLGPLIESHPAFPERVNVGFMELVSKNEIRLRVFERGVGETEACGSGACAAAVHGIRRGLLDNAVTVHLPGGKLSVTWSGADNDDVWLAGPTASVFEGVVKLREG